MDLSLLSTLVKSINPKAVYDYEFPEGEKAIKAGKDWIGTFVSMNKQIENTEGEKLIEHFKNPDKEKIQKKESHKDLQTKKN